MRPASPGRQFPLLRYRQVLTELKMPYVSETEKIRAQIMGRRWMTLADAISHIRMTEKCDQAEGWRQLRNAIHDGNVRVRVHV